MNRFCTAVTLFALAACGAEAHTTEESKPAPAPATAPATAPSAATSSAATAAPKAEAAPATARKVGDPLSFTPASDWVVETPSSKMRVAQYKLPKAAGDNEDAELVVYHFGSMGGGTIDANLERWAGQFEQPDGSKSADKLERSQRLVNGIPVTEVRLIGTFVAETAPGSGVRVNKPGFAMLAAIFDNGDSDYYAKLTGPAATVEHHAAAFRDFISRAK